MNPIPHTTSADIETEWTSVTSSAGDLRALVHHRPDRTGPKPGLVLVDGSGDGACDDWGEWPERFVDCGAVVLTHDKPGSGGSPGDWTTQTFEDRAADTLAAADTLRRHPAVAGGPVGLLGVSQGGWVALLAHGQRPDSAEFVITLSGPGVGVAEQERYRIARALRDQGSPEDAVTEALAWIDERTERLLAGEPVESILADQEGLARRTWYATAIEPFDNPVLLGFLAGILDHDPVPSIQAVRCPVLALFGGNDTLVPAMDSAISFASHLPALPGAPHGVTVFPHADHGLFIADPDPAIPRTEQLAPGFLPMVAGFLADATERARAAQVPAAPTAGGRA